MVARTKASVSAKTAGRLAYLGTGREELALDADGAARAVLLGGEPFEAPVVMWWNFVARTHDEVVAFRAAWEDDPEERFGHVTGYVGPDGGTARLHAPALPNARIKPRG